MSPCALLTTQATGGRVGPTGARTRAQPIPPSPAVGQAGRLFAMPATGKHQDPEPKGHLPHLRSLPLGLARTGLVPESHRCCPQSGDVPSPARHPWARASPKPPASAGPVCLSICFSLSGYLLASLSLSLFLAVLTSSHLSHSAASPFSGMTPICLLSLSLYVQLSLFPCSEV